MRADGSLTGLLPETVEPQHRYSHVSGRDFGPLIARDRLGCRHWIYVIMDLTDTPESILPDPKRQHFIPILHLQHFVGTDPQGQVWTYDAETGDVRSAIPKETAVQSHFYSVEGDDGAMDTRIEDFLAKMESNAAPAYQALLRAEIPTKGSQARVDFATFLALMYVRTPAMRRMGAEMIGRHMQILCYAYGNNEKAFDALNLRAETGGMQPLNAEQKERLRRDFLDPSGYIMQIAKERTLMVLRAADGLAPILYNMKWTIIIPAHGFFITTDHPLVRQVDPKTRHPIYGDHGFANKTVEVIFPLSPQRILVMTWEEGARDIAALERTHVEKINQALAAHSDRYLYSHIRHKRLKELAAEFKASRPMMTTQGFGPKKFAKIEVPRRMGTT